MTTVRSGVRVHRVDALTASQAADWDALVQRSDLPSPFLRSWWLVAVADRGSTFLLVSDGPELVGGLALQRRRLLGVTRWQLLGEGKLCPDHLDLVTLPHRAAEVGAALHAHLTRSGSWLLDLHGLREDSHLAAAWHTAGTPFELRVIDRAPFIRLPATYPEYLAGRSRSFTRKARKLTRRAESAGTRIETVEPDRVPWALDRFEDLNRARGDRTELLRQMPRIRRAFESGVAAGEAAVHVATLGDRVGAVSLVLTACDVTRNYQTVRSLERDLDGSAMLTHLSVIAAACEQGHREFDFLRGTDPYKDDYTDDRRPLLGARAARGAGRLVLAALRWTGRARPVLAGWLRRAPGRPPSTRSRKKV